MLDSIKQKLEKLNPIESTSLKKAGVFIGILYHDEYINKLCHRWSILIFTNNKYIEFIIWYVMPI